MIHRINVFLLSIILIFSQTFLIVSANTVGGSIGGWQVVTNVANGIGAKLTATKEVMVNGASKVMTGTANITPNAGGVAKFMAKAGTAAVVVNAMDLILDGVDYVMDPANNSVHYKTKPSDTTISCSTSNNCDYAQSLFKDGNYPNVGTFSTPQALANAVLKHRFPDLVHLGLKSRDGCYFLNSSDWLSVVSCPSSINNPSYNPDASNESKPASISLPNLGSQVIEQAEKDIKAGNPASPAVILGRLVAQGEIAEAELDDTKAPPIVNQFQKNPEYPTSEEAEGTITHPPITDPITGEVTPVPPSSISLDFPVFCSWAPSLCVMADSVIQSIADVKEWVKTENPANTETEVKVIEPEEQEKKEDLLKWSAYCPFQKESNDITINGEKSSFDSDLTSWCDTAKDIKPFVLLAGALASLMIVSGVSIRGDE